ncbi:MAG: hypothetical protein PHU06_08000 [Gallionella sp.]|nr:hypothetical protein [Gallionella sp.]MDD4960192.1 hypothetical protein [Gallionella sp.]
MNKQEIRAMLAITSLAFGSDLMAQGVSKGKEKVVDRPVEVACQPVKRSPDSLAEHANLISLGVARGLNVGTKAKVRVRTKPSQVVGLAIKVAEPASVTLAITTASILTDIDKLMALHMKA